MKEVTALKKAGKSLESLYGLAIGGATLAKGTDLLAHARTPAAIPGDIQGFAGIGIAGGMGSVVMRQAARQYKYKRKKKRR